MRRASSSPMPAAPAGADAQQTGLSAWANQPVWHELETGFGAGLNFLRRWRDWRADVHRPGRLFYTAIDPEPVALAELLQAAAGEPGLSALAQQLAAQWQALLPGVHRFVFEGERLLLTLCVGQARDWLPTLDAAVDQIWLTAPEPAVERRAVALARELYSHALVNPHDDGTAADERALKFKPSYIEPKLFAIAMLDTIQTIPGNWTQLGRDIDAIDAEIAEGKVGAERIVALKPMTYMNNSGEAVAAAARAYGATEADLIVVYDEVELEPGKIRSDKLRAAYLRATERGK